MDRPGHSSSNLRYDTGNITMIDTIICIGNGQEQASHQGRKIALKNKIPWMGVLDFTTEVDKGCYHTSIYDIKAPSLLDKIINKNVKIIVLDQDQSYYTDELEFYKTLDLAQSMVNTADVEFLNKDFDNPIKQLLTNNKSFCIMPFISIFAQKGNISSCCFMESSITTVKELTNFNTDDKIQNVRQQMVRGDLVGEHCSHCYDKENLGMISHRTTYTVDWAYRENFKSLDDIANNIGLKNYELSVGNKCNAMCRSCNSKYSDLINQEYVKIGLAKEVKIFKGDFDVVNIAEAKRVYLNGGEPTISKDFILFLQRCIALNRTDLEIVVNTNGFKLTDTLMELVHQFPNFKFEISVDGYKDLQTYVRWPIPWDTFVGNVTKMYDITNKKISFNTVVSIYNIANLYEIFSFLESNYPGVESHLNNLTNLPHLVYTNFPDKQLALNNLEKIKSLKFYKENNTFRSRIDSITYNLQHTKIDIDVLKKFFEFNDLLDKSRNIRLKDYVPSLDRGRNII
jgi:MoaA/NifB/PqqE/SkfB family radical SAM enzyme